MLSIIVAIARDGAIGRAGDQPFYISDDLKHFKQLTSGHPVIMGRRTYDALPRKPLPGRQNIIITRNADYVAPGAVTVGSLEEAVALLGDAEGFVIGGGRVYSDAIDLADRLYVTEINADVPDADTFFPPIDPAKWRADDIGEWKIDPATQLRYRFICYFRK